MVLGVCYLFGCRNAPHSTSTPKTTTHTDQVLVKDSSKAGIRLEPSGSVGGDTGISKFGTNADSQGGAIHHGSPDQEKIDSIKAAKQKGK